MIRVRVDVKTKTESNANEHWRTRATRARKQRTATMFALMAATRTKPKLPCVVRLTRYSSALMDFDNLVSSGKHIVDSIAKWLGCGDGPNDPLRFEYQQSKCPRGQQWTTIEIWGAGETGE